MSASGGAAAGNAAAGDCVLCRSDGGIVLARTRSLRVVRVDDPDHPGTLRVIWNAHVAEMSDLDESQRVRLMAAVHAAETALRQALQPDKMNLASLGNQVPHLHWHVIARFKDDAHFPQPIWAAPVRPSDAAKLAARRQMLTRIEPALNRLLPPE